MTSKENMLNLRQIIKLNETEQIKDGGGVVGQGGGGRGVL